MTHKNIKNSNIHLNIALKKSCKKSLGLFIYQFHLGLEIFHIEAFLFLAGVEKSFSSF